MDVATSTIMNQRQKQNRSMVMCSMQYYYICCPHDSISSLSGVSRRSIGLVQARCPPQMLLVLPVNHRLLAWLQAQVFMWDVVGTLRDGFISWSNQATWARIPGEGPRAHDLACGGCLAVRSSCRMPLKQRKRAYLFCRGAFMLCVDLAMFAS